MWGYLTILVLMPLVFILSGCNTAPDCRDIYLFSTPMDCEYKKQARKQAPVAPQKKAVPLLVMH